MTPLVIIPARAGSVRVPHKNVRRVLGQSLLERAIMLGIKIGHVVVTTDDPVAKQQATRLHVDVIDRPKRLATRRASSADVILHAQEAYPRYGDWLLVQPTTPTRTEAHVRRVLRRARQTATTVAASVGWTGDSWRLTGAAYAGSCGRSTRPPYEGVVWKGPWINVDTPADWAQWVAFRTREVRR